MIPADRHRRVTVYVARTVYILGAPLLLVWDVGARFGAETRRAWRATWIEAKGSWRDLRAGWRRLP